jgi:hypothetical protein
LEDVDAFPLTAETLLAIARVLRTYSAPPHPVLHANIAPPPGLDQADNTTVP